MNSIMTTALGSFDTVQQALTSNDLGTVFPTDGLASWKNATQLAPGQTTTQWISIVRSGSYQVELSNQAIGMQLIRVDDTGSELMATTTSGATSTGHYDLDPGLYQIIATNPTEVTQTVAFAASPIQSSGESLSLGGVGQMPAITNNSFLLGSATTNAGSMPASVAVSPLAMVAIDHTPQGSVGPTNIPLAATGSFRLGAFDQAPLGSFSAPNAATAPAVTSPGAVAVALGSTMILDLGATTSSRPWIHSDDLVVQEPLGSPNDSAQLAGDRPTNQPEMLTAGAGERNDVAPTNEIGAAVAAAGAGDPESRLVLDTAIAAASRWPLVDQLMDEAGGESEPVSLSREIAGLASPFGLVVASCVLYHRIKVARSQAPTWGWARIRSLGHWPTPRRSPALPVPNLIPE